MADSDDVDYEDDVVDETAVVERTVVDSSLSRKGRGRQPAAKSGGDKARGGIFDRLESASNAGAPVKCNSSISPKYIITSTWYGSL